MRSCQRVKNEDKNITKEALLYNDIYKYLLEGAYREEAPKDEKKMIRRSAALFFVEDGLLFRKDELRIVDKDNQLKVM